MGRSIHAYENLHELRQHKQTLLTELTDLKRQEDKLQQFIKFKQSVLQQLQQTYIEFLTYLLKFLDVSHNHNQQKFVYWTNLKHFTYELDLNTGCDIPKKLETKLDQLFGAIQQTIQSISLDDIKTIQSQLDKSILYQMFIRSNCEYRTILCRSPIRYADLLMIQKRLLVDMRREKTVDPIVKRFHDEWLVPQLHEQVMKKTPSQSDTKWAEISVKLHKLLKRVFQTLDEVKTADELERVVWLITRQWNYLFLECDRRLILQQEGCKQPM